MKKKIAIIGFGRFGKLLSDMLKKNFDLLIHDVQRKNSVRKSNRHFVSLEEALEAESIFIAVPISAFSAVIKKIATHIPENRTVIDLCSVKVEPVKIMRKFLPKKTDIIATHPMFGPDSFKINPHLKMVMHKVRDQHKRYAFWKKYFKERKIQILEMPPQAHDEMTAHSQTLTHLVGRILEKMPVKSTPINTTGFEKLLAIQEQTCKDSWQLFCDLQNYNPYAKKMRKKFESALNEVTKNLKSEI